MHLGRSDLMESAVQDIQGGNRFDTLRCTPRILVVMPRSLRKGIGLDLAGQLLVDMGWMETRLSVQIFKGRRQPVSVKGNL